MKANTLFYIFRRPCRFQPYRLPVIIDPSPVMQSPTRARIRIIIRSICSPFRVHKYHLCTFDTQAIYFYRLVQTPPPTICEGASERERERPTDRNHARIAVRVFITIFASNLSSSLRTHESTQRRGTACVACRRGTEILYTRRYYTPTMIYVL